VLLVALGASLALGAGLLALGAGLLTPPCFAGVYNPAEPLIGPAASSEGIKPLPFSQFRSQLNELLQIGIEKPSSAIRDHYIKRRQELAGRRDLNIDEQVQLSAYLIRLRQYDDAVSLLTPIAAVERRNFMVFANLATAQQLLGRLDRARDYLDRAADIWPAELPGLSKAQLDWYRRAERCQRNLVMSRMRETVQPPGSNKAVALDDVFRPKDGPVQFVGESGRYEPGKLAARERAKLPADAVAIVQQLLLRMPEDTRLYWLLGELYNADGDLDSASKAFEDCVWSRRFDAPELRQHIQLVQEARPKSEALALEDTTNTPTPAATPTNPGWLPDTRKLIIVGLFVGGVIVLLGYFQVRELRRRRKSTSS
jgi:tetratricopeptide (TPR) repeat protein